jgi:hypothetical protein
MQEYVFVVLTNAAPGREAEYNDWYDNRHLIDVTKVPGIVTARRYRLSEVQRRELPPDQQRYLSLYNIVTDDLQTTIKTLAARSGTREMPISDAMVRGRAVIYQPIGPVVGPSDINAHLLKK